MTIGEILRHEDIDTYHKLMKAFKTEIDEPRKIELGDTPENLMKADSYKRVGRRVRQVKWG